MSLTLWIWGMTFCLWGFRQTGAGCVIIHLNPSVLGLIIGNRRVCVCVCVRRVLERDRERERERELWSVCAGMPSSWLDRETSLTTHSFSSMPPAALLSHIHINSEALTCRCKSTDTHSVLVSHVRLAAPEFLVPEAVDDFCGRPPISPWGPVSLNSAETTIPVDKPIHSLVMLVWLRWESVLIMIA